MSLIFSVVYPKDCSLLETRGAHAFLITTAATCSHMKSNSNCEIKDCVKTSFWDVR